MKRITKLAVLLPVFAVLTGCAKPYVPPVDDMETEMQLTEMQEDTAETPSASETASETAGTETETNVTETAGSETRTSAAFAGTADAASTTVTTADPHQSSSVIAWADAYAELLRKKDISSEHVDAYYALIRLNPDKVPELCVLDDVYMELYTFRDGEAELLMEDAYKSSAVMDQNVCFQPIVGKFASYFSTMGGGTGFNIYVYEQLDTLHVTRYCFNNNEDEGGEMPYNTIWDSAETFGVSNNGWADVTLGDDWIHIGRNFEYIEELERKDADSLLEEWDSILQDDDDDYYDYDDDHDDDDD